MTESNAIYVSAIIGSLFVTFLPGVFFVFISKPKEVDKELTTLRKGILDYLRSKIGIFIAEVLPYQDILNGIMTEKELNALIQNKVKDALKDDKEVLLDFYKASILFEKFRWWNKNIRHWFVLLIFCGLLLLVLHFCVSRIPAEFILIASIILTIFILAGVCCHEKAVSNFKDICNKYEII